MARKTRRKISYVLPLSSSAQGHRLGVNGLAVDPPRELLYSAGRDGVIYAWYLNLRRDHVNSSHAISNVADSSALPSTVRQTVQAHSHWINDIALADDNNALVSASSDVTVKLWRPHAQESPAPPQTIGAHTDYVKVLAVPSSSSTWVASGGLDHRICLWDLTGAGTKLDINVGADGDALTKDDTKCGVYALAATDSLLASGGPDGDVCLWDPRTGRSVAQFLSHTDNIRALMISRDDSKIVSASSDQTIRVWDVASRRCLNVLNAHDTSVWSLDSHDDQLRTFHSADRNGLVIKHVLDADDASHVSSIAVCHEHEGVSKLATTPDHIWTATSRPTINRWTNPPMKHDEHDCAMYGARRTSTTSIARSRTTNFSKPHVSTSVTGVSRSSKRSNVGSRRPSEQSTHVDALRVQPEHTISGQTGLIKHTMLNDRRRVLTTDSSGEVSMWDLLQCRSIRSFGLRPMEDLAAEVNTQEGITSWCSVDTKTGALTITLEDHSCFDAEMYYDELRFTNAVTVKEDQRVNLGRWILRYLCDSIVEAELLRDGQYRHHIQQNHDSIRPSRAGAPLSLQIPTSTSSVGGPNQSPTASRRSAFRIVPSTPGLGISMASPLTSPVSPVSPVRETGYFSKSKQHTDGTAPTTPAPYQSPTEPRSPEASDTPDKFGKKLRKNMISGFKKLGRAHSSDVAKTEIEPDMHVSFTTNLPVSPEGRESQSTDSADNQESDETMHALIKRVQQEYADQLEHVQSSTDQDTPQLNEDTTLGIPSLLTPVMPADLPRLCIPPDVLILIQEDRPAAGGAYDLFESTVSNLDTRVDDFERAAPRWLGEFLLRDRLPAKEIAKQAFVLEPWQLSLPSIANDGNNRLSATRMLRARKILAYVADRIYPDRTEQKAEDLLELWCNDHCVPPKMTLASMRTMYWKSANDMVLYYKEKPMVAFDHVQSASVTRG